MKRINVLYSSGEIHASIKKLFSEPSTKDRRVALVAYIGGDGESYLPHPKGLHVICNPSPGGTNPDTLRGLIKRGAKVEFSDRLHMKVYWSQSQGCIITSANASSSALGVMGLREAGAYFPPGIVDIDRLINYANPRPVRQSDLDELDRGAKEQKKNAGKKRQKRESAPEFLGWYTSSYRRKWKIVWSEEEVSGTAKVAKAMTFTEYGLKEPYTWVTAGKGRVSRNDRLLSFFFTANGVKSIQWIYVDFIVKISPKETRYYYKDWPYHAVQVHAPSHYPFPPFRITSAFRKALRNAIKRYSRERIMEAKSDVPPVRLLKFIEEEMKT